MTEKRKPYASIAIYQPRFSRVVLTAILLLLITALGSLAWREIDGWRTALSETELRLEASSELLRQRADRLQAVEAKLEKAQRRLRTDPLTWRTLEPAGFSVEPSINGWQGRLTATVCARGHRYYEAYTHFFSLNRFFVSELTLSGNYELVGRERYDAGGTVNDRYIRYYTHKDVLEFNSYTPASAAYYTSVHVDAWRSRLASYCSASFE